MTGTKSYPFRHRLISFLRDIDVKGIRKVSLMLPKLLLPKAKNTAPYILETIHCFKLHINPALDNGVELSLHETGTYEKGILLYLRSILKKGDCFVDVGANIGLMSIFTAECVGDEGKVLAFEAHPNTSELLMQNIQLNSLSNIEVKQYALGSIEGKTNIYDNWQVNRGGASLVVKTKDSVAYEIEVKKLDTVFPEGITPKAIKIDVEGFELEVLKGAAETIRKHKPVLIVELSENRSNAHDSSAELISFIKSLGSYRIYKLKGGKERKSKLVEIASNAQLPQHDNVICIHH